jgi:precorrin-6B methylase 2
MSRSNAAERALLDILTAYQLPAVLGTAERLGILDELAAGTTQARLRRRCRISARGAKSMVGVLVAAGLAKSQGERLFLTRRGRLLVEGGRGGLRNILRKEAFFARLWVDLDVSVRTGRALLPAFPQRAAREPEDCTAYLRALNDLTDRVADDVLAAVDQGSPRSLLDVGGGGGALAAAAAHRLPHTRVFILEVPEVAPITRQLLAERGEEDVQVISGDALDPAAARDIAPLDVVIVSHLLHDLGPEKAALLLRNVVSWLRPGGTVVVHDVLAPTRPDLTTALFDVMMLVENPGGQVHSEQMVRSWLRSAGVRRVRRADLGWTAILRGIKG